MTDQGVPAGPLGALGLSRRTLAILAGLVVLALASIFLLAKYAGEAHRDSADSGSASQPAPTASATPVSGLPTVRLAELPVQARDMLALIDKGGPYRYSQDGVVFGNFEGLLPARTRGYYHEYTVVTPGSKDRGTRRLVVGQLGDVYYTSDHYESFRQVLR